MRIFHLTEKILILLIFLTLGGCDGKIEQDPCDLTKWNLPKEYEIKLAVHISASNQLLPGGTTGSQNPEDFRKMVVGGTIEKIECNDETTAPINMGNTYIDKGTDTPAPIDVSMAYWIGHVVYVYAFDNDKDHIIINLNVKITMEDKLSYMCNITKDEIYHTHIEQVPGEMYYYILIEINTDSWIKV